MEHQDREDRLLNIAKLIRAKGHIRDLRNQALLPAISHKVQEAYANCMKLRVMVKIVNSLENNKHRETHKEKYRRCSYIYHKNKLIEDIEEAIKFLMSQSNFLNTRSCVVSVLDDLARATLIFKVNAMNGTIDFEDEESQEDLSRKDKLKENLNQTEEVQEDLGHTEELQEDLSKNEESQEDLLQTEELQEDLRQTEELQEDLSKNAELEVDLVQTEVLQDLRQTEELQEDLSKDEELQEGLGHTEELQEDSSKNEELQEDLRQTEESQEVHVKPKNRKKI